MGSIFDQIIGTVNKSTPEITLESLTTIAEINGMSIETDSYEEDSSSMLADAMEAMGAKVKYEDDYSASEIAALEKDGAADEDPDDDDETIEEMASGYIDEYYETEKDDALSALSDTDLDDIDDDFEGGYEASLSPFPIEKLIMDMSDMELTALESYVNAFENGLEEKVSLFSGGKL